MICLLPQCQSDVLVEDGGARMDAKIVCSDDTEEGGRTQHVIQNG